MQRSRFGRAERRDAEARAGKRKRGHAVGEWATCADEKREEDGGSLGPRIETGVGAGFLVEGSDSVASIGAKLSASFSRREESASARPAAATRGCRERARRTLARPPPPPRPAPLARSSLPSSLVEAGMAQAAAITERHTWPRTLRERERGAEACAERGGGGGDPRGPICRGEAARGDRQRRRTRPHRHRSQTGAWLWPPSPPPSVAWARLG